MSVLRKIVDEKDARRCLARLARSGETLRSWARSNGVDGRSLRALQKQLEALVAQQNEASPAQPASDPASPPAAKQKVTPKGRRDLSASTLPRVVVDITDAKLAQLGKLIGYEESYQLMYVRGGFKVLEKRTAKYEVPSASGPTVLGVEAPRTLFPRTMLHPSLLAFIAVQKFALGVPHYRLEQHMDGQGLELDRPPVSG